MDELTKAIIAAGEELHHEYDWRISDGGFDVSSPEASGPFVKVLRKHIAPLVGDGWREARIEALKAELAQLEAHARP